MEGDDVARAMQVADTSALDMEKALWRLDGLEVNALALCADAAVAVVGERKPVVGRKGNAPPGILAWRLMAFDHRDGRQKWAVDLPGEPVMNGLAPAGDGAWLLTLRDGSMVAVGQ
jgi:hypothetical protein